MAMWRPALDEHSGPKYLQIVDALANDIVSGVLKPGMRLPPHRDLAYDLGVSPNTTSRAYAEGVARALIQGEVGRGTYVRWPGQWPSEEDRLPLTRRHSGPIDFSRNLPSPGLAERYLADTLSALGASTDLRALMDDQSEAGPARHSEAAIAWLARTGVEADADEVAITIGAQHGILAALMAVTRPGDLLLTEELTYAPVKAMAERLGLKIKAVALDDGGLCPDTFDQICGTHAVKALYFTPTLHTPTTITMADDRRERITAIAQRRGVFLIEDDVFGTLKPDGPPPVATFASECTLYVTSTSKCLAPGLRVGFVRAPAAQAAAIRSAVNLSCWMAPPLMVEIAARWMEDGTADRLTAAQRSQATKRQNMARTILSDCDIRADRHGLHLWLVLPAAWPADIFRIEAQNRGVKLVEAAAFAVTPGDAPNAVRLCLSHEPDERRLQSGLQTVKTVLQGTPEHSALVL